MYRIPIFILFICTSCNGIQPKNEVKKQLFEIHLEKDLILIFDKEYQVILRDKIKQDGVVTGIIYLGKDTIDVVYYITYSLNKKNISWANIDSNRENQLKIVFNEHSKSLEDKDPKLIQSMQNYKIGDFTFYKLHYPGIETEIWGASARYTMGIDISNDSNEIYLKSLKNIIQK